MNDQEELDQLIDKFMNHDKLERPSLNFTDKVMSEVAKANDRKIVYQPLLPKYVMVIGLLGIIVFAFLGVNSNGTDQDISGYLLNFQEVNSWFSNVLGSFEISKELSYTVIITGLMVCVQVLFLKKHFDKRFA